MKTQNSITETSRLFLSLASLALMLTKNNLIAQNNPEVDLHVNTEIGQCDFDISYDLTQAEWKKATKEIGNILYLNPLSSAKPLGVKNWDLQVETTSSNVDQESGAWNNTFHHPDSTHYLSSNGRTAVPALRFRMGLTDKFDAGIYYSSAQPFGANYGILGFELKCAFINDTTRNWAASVRASYVTDANIKDFNISTTGIDFSVSKTFFAVVAPYAGVAMNYNHSKEVTDEVDLENENYFGVRGVIGAELKWEFVNLGYEFMIGDGYSNRALKVGVTF